MKDEFRSGVFQNFDWPLLGTILALCFIGLMTLYSSTYLTQITVFYKQLFFIGLGILLAILITLFDYRWFERFAFPIYGFSIALLMLVPFIGKTVSGSQRWIALGPINIQPSEIMKLAIVFILAKFYSSEKAHLKEGYGFKDLIPIFMLVGFPMILVFLQPDLGTALMIGFIAFTIILSCNQKYFSRPIQRPQEF